LRTPTLHSLAPSQEAEPLRSRSSSSARSGTREAKERARASARSEVYFGAECYGRQASQTTKRLLPPGSRVRLFAEPATDRVDQYERLLRYVVRVDGALNVNLRLVAVGAAAPYFYRRRRGRYANRLEALAGRARALKLGLWRACPHTPYDPYRGVQTRR
jgi:endonuclease YncB( thermonuclease family)